MRPVLSHASVLDELSLSVSTRPSSGNLSVSSCTSNIASTSPLTNQTVPNHHTKTPPTGDQSRLSSVVSPRGTALCNMSNHSGRTSDAGAGEPWPRSMPLLAPAMRNGRSTVNPSLKCCISVSTMSMKPLRYHACFRIEANCRTD